MNSSRMHGIIQSLEMEFSRVDSPKLLSEIITHLQNQINQPNQPTYQNQLTTSLEGLKEQLKNSPVDKFSPVWLDALSELGVQNEFGIRLSNRISEIFERNTITPQTALDDLTKINDELKGTQDNVMKLSSGLTYFGIGQDVLHGNEAELGVVIPRVYVDNNLKEFGAELIDLEKTLLVFTEVVTGSREPLKIRQISSSELSVFLEYVPEVCACVAFSIERIVALYKSLLEIKTLKQGLLAQDVSEESLQGITDHSESIVKPKLEELAEEIMSKYGDKHDKGRKNELVVEVRQSLYKLSNRVDRGFQIELRVSEELISDDDSDATESSEAATQIIVSASKIKNLGAASEPVLFLPEADNDKD